LKAVTGCAKTYVMLFAEAQGFRSPHLHVVPRSGDLPGNYRGPVALKAINVCGLMMSWHWRVRNGRGDRTKYWKVKRIEVRPGHRLSYQRHAHRAEHWLVVSGIAQVTPDGSVIDLGPGDAIDVPIGSAHRVANQGKDTLLFIEVQRGDYFGEDDIERLEDDFGRLS
jgi:mannose-6-phosphate isomerase